MTWIEQPVQVNHEVAHVGIVHGLLRLRFPGCVSGSVIGEHTDDFDLIEVLERGVFEIGQFAANDEMAFGAIDAIASRGLKVPADISVVGFDDISTASHVFPRLTTMHQPYEALAERAVHEVVEMIEGRPPAAARIAFATELVVRDSTGPAPV